MKVFIALALLAVAFANPMVQPITLPNAPVPAVETDFEVPAGIQMPDISPLMVPPEISAMLNAEGALVAELPEDYVPINLDAGVFIDHFEQAEIAVPSKEEIVADPVKIVDFAPVAEDQVPINPDAVAIVDHFDGLPEEYAPINIDAAVVIDHFGDFENIARVPINEAPVNADAVVTVDHFEIAENEVPSDAKIVADPVKIVDFAAVPQNEVPINAESVVIVDHFDVSDAAVSSDAEIVADQVKIVDVAENISNDIPKRNNMFERGVQGAPVYVPYPEMYYGNPKRR